MLRSEEMTLVQIIERTDVARTVVTELGSEGVMHFRDLNGDTPFYKRAFADEIKRCDDMVRRVNYLTAQVEAAELESPTATAPVPLEVAEEAIRQTQTDLRESANNLTNVERSHNALKEHIQVLALGGKLFGTATVPMAPKAAAAASAARAIGGGLSEPLLASAFPTGKGAPTGPAGAGDENVLYVQAGTLSRSLTPSLMRAVHRVSRGNCVVHDMPVDGELLGKPPDARGSEVTRPGPYPTWTLPDLDPTRPGPYQTWALPDLDPKPGLWLLASILLPLLSPRSLLLGSSTLRWEDGADA